MARPPPLDAVDDPLDDFLRKISARDADHVATQQRIEEPFDGDEIESERPRMLDRQAVLRERAAQLTGETLDVLEREIPIRNERDVQRVLEAAHAANQRFRVAAMVELNHRTLGNRSRVRGQHVDDRLEIVRIADLDERRAQRDDRFALLHDAQNLAGDR